MLLQIQTSPERSHEEPLNVQQLKDLDRLLKLELKNLSFTLGSLVYFNFFNKQLTLKIIYWTSLNTHNDDDTASILENSFKKLSLSDDVFKVTNTTTIEVSSENIPTSDEETEDTSKYLITKEDIGGLTKQLEIIEEAMEFALSLRAIPQGKKN